MRKIWTYTTQVSVFVLGLALAGCGGGGGGGGAPSVSAPVPTPSPAPSPTPTPAPTPAPAPTPTPNPTPTPPPLVGAISTELQTALESGPLNSTDCTTTGCGGSVSGVSYNSSTNSYSLNFIGSVSINAADQSSGPVSGFKYFSNNGPSGQKNIILAHDNATATQALTFTSYISSIDIAASTPDISAHIFGLPSATLPTAGKATYSGSVGGFANDGSNNFVISGTSDLTVDFAQQSYRTNLNFAGTNLVAGGAALSSRSYTGSNSGFGYPLEASTSFGGSLTGAGGTAGTGNFIGRFFGPNRTEYGYVFNLSGGGITAAGAAAGTQQSSTAAASQPTSVATALPSAVLNSLQAGTLSGGDFAALNESTSGSLITQVSISAPISYNATTGLYTLTLASPGGTAEFGDGDGIAGALAGMAFFRTLNKDPNARSSDIYGNPIGPYDTTILPNTAAHGGIALTYTSFALSVSQTDGGVPHSYLATTFGVPATSVPTTGTASYSGIVSGFARATGNGSTVYIISGTSSLTANFAANSYSTALSFTGQTLDGGQTLATQNYSGVSSGSLVNGSALNGSLTGSGSGNWAGRFYGPGAAEYGYTFGVTGAGYNTVGAAVGTHD